MKLRVVEERQLTKTVRERQGIWIGHYTRKRHFGKKDKRKEAEHDAEH